MVTEARKRTMREWYEANRERARFQEAFAKDKLRLEMVEAYGGKCQHCPECDPLVLQLDHINDDPDEEYAIFKTSGSRGGYRLYRHLKKQNWPKDRFQLLCANCNLKKEFKRRRDRMVEEYGAAPEVGMEITRGEARAKAGPNTNNKSGFKGVFWRENRQGWQAQLRFNGELKYFGCFTDVRDTAKAYRKGALETWGEFAEVLTDEQIEDIASKIKKPVVSQTTCSIEELDL